jgi:RimJ/RimL family protein N-acetyltransferase
MINQKLLEKVRPWIESQLGYSLPAKATESPALGPLSAGNLIGALFGVRVDDVVAFSASSEWHDQLRPILNEIHPDLLFSIAGTYELSRVTLPDGWAVWGPVPCYVASEHTWKSVNDSRVEHLTEEQVAEIDWDIFWHCGKTDSLAHFGIYEDDRLVALSSVNDHGFDVYEIGVDAVQGSQGRGLGTAVVGAAGDWILDQGATPFASAAAWNVPSGRNLRKLGLQYTYSALIGRRGEFKVPPQPIGQPLPGYEVYDHYPRWAMNRDILETRE